MHIRTTSLILGLFAATAVFIAGCTATTIPSIQAERQAEAPDSTLPADGERRRAHDSGT